MSDIPRYDGTIQPEVWLQDLRFFCALRGIYDNDAVLGIAILRIDHNIHIPKDINSFNSLILALKNHFTHTVFREDSLEKLSKLKCERNRDISEFIAKFIPLCSSANITDLKKKKDHLLRALPDDIVRSVFRNQIKNLNSFDNVIETFKDVMLEHKRQIRYGSKIALKHVVTGRFLSSKDIKYTTGSTQHMVFCSGWRSDEQDIWIVIPSSGDYCQPGSPVQFNSVIGLKHQKTGRNLHSHNGHESPKTKQQEVTCFENSNADDNWLLQRHSTTSNYDNSGCWMIGDIISLRHVQTKKSLLSHEFLLDNGNQEVTCNEDGHEENHKWCVEILD